MAFTWNYSFIAEAKILAGCTSHGSAQAPSPYGKGGIDIQEVRDNVDWLKDNLVCQTHDSANNPAHNSVDNAIDRAIHYTTYNGSQDVVNYIGHLATAKSGDNSAALLLNDSTAYSKVNSTYYNGNKSGDETSHWHTHYGVYLSGHNSGYLSGHNVTYKAVYCSLDFAKVTP